MFGAEVLLTTAFVMSTVKLRDNAYAKLTLTAHKEAVHNVASTTKGNEMFLSSVILSDEQGQQSSYAQLQWTQFHTEHNVSWCPTTTLKPPNPLEHTVTRKRLTEGPMS